MPRFMPNSASAAASLARPVGDHGADLAGGGEQRGGLALDHLQVARLRRGQVVLGDKLQHLALGDGRRGAREDGQHDQRAVLHHQLEGAGEQEVADQHRGLVAEHRVGRGQPAPQQALVHHVVVQQRRGVDELDAGGELARAALAGIAAQPRRGEREQRAQPLAAGGDDVRGELRDQRHRAVHAGDDGAVAGLQIVVQQADQRAQRVLLGRGARVRARKERRTGPGRLATTSKLVSWLACLADTGTISAPWKTGQGSGREEPSVRVLATSNDPVRLSFLTALLADAGIAAMVLDAHTSAVEGSIGAIPRRLVVAAEDEPRARRVLEEAGEI